MGKQRIYIKVNGEQHRLKVGEEPHQIGLNDTLAHTLKETLSLTGTKVSGDSGACGGCTVLMDGKAVLSCMILTIECDEKEISTIEGLRDPITGALDPLQQSFIDHTAFQCDFCTPGMIMSAKSLLIENPHPTEEEKNARIALGAVAPSPVRVKAAEELMIGRSINGDFAVKVAEEALAGAKPLSKNAYKVDIAKTLIKRSILGFSC